MIAPLPSPPDEREAPEVPGPHRRWPAERFYWSVLDAPPCRAAGPLPTGLADQFEQDVPRGAEDLHAVIAPVGDGRVIVCAAPRAALESLDRTALSLTPESLAACIPAAVDPASLNLLVGEFEPRPLRRARSRRHQLAATCVVLCATMLASGLLRRAERHHQLEELAAAAAAALLTEAGGREPALLQELLELRGSSRVGASVRPAAADAAPLLAAVLAAWPASVPSKPMSLTVSDREVFAEITLGGEPSAFLAALKLPPGWTLQEPRLNTAGNLTRLSLSMVPPQDHRP